MAACGIMSQIKNVTRFAAAIALLVGFAVVAPSVSAAEEDTETPSAETTQTIPPCATFNPEYNVGPATAGIDDTCSPYASVDLDLDPDEDPTEKCSVTTSEDKPFVLVRCQLSTTSEPHCYHIYWKKEVGPVTWEQRSSCDGDITVDKDWRPDTDPSTTSTCLQIYYKIEIGPVVYERSGCDSQLYVDENWQPSDEIPR
jgi:hypothetical protein